MILYLILGLGSFAFGAAGVAVAMKRLKYKALLFLVVTCLGGGLAALGLALAIPALANGGRVENDHTGIVQTVLVTTSGDKNMTTLELRGGARVDCEPVQLACQKARTGDLVIYTRTWSASGHYVEKTKATFVTPGPNSLPR